MAEYEDLRQLVNLAMPGLPEWHPCQRGVAKCCEERDVPVTPGDEQVIKDAIGSGEIAPEVVERAQRRAADPSVRQCPWLGDNRDCTVNSSKPVVCETAGAAGLPLPQDLPFMQAKVDAYYATRKEQGYPVARTESSMCADCHNKLTKEGAEFPISSMLVQQRVARYYQAAGTEPMVDFVSSLPSPRAEQPTRRKPSPPRRARKRKR